MGLRDNPQNAGQITKLSMQDFDAQMQHWKSKNPQLVRKVTLELDTETNRSIPKKLGFVFQSVYVQSASDADVEVNIIPYDSDEGKGEFPLRLKDALNFSIPIQNTSFTWDAQAGKQITLIFLTHGTFASGSQLTEIRSSVDGNSISTPAPVVLAAATPALLMAQDLNRSVLNMISNAPFEIAGDITGGGGWFPQPANTYIKIKNTAAIYANSASGATVKFLTES